MERTREAQQLRSLGEALLQFLPWIGQVFRRSPRILRSRNLRLHAIPSTAAARGACVAPSCSRLGGVSNQAAILSSQRACACSARPKQLPNLPRPGARLLPTLPTRPTPAQREQSQVPSPQESTEDRRSSPGSPARPLQKLRSAFRQHLCGAPRRHPSPSHQQASVAATNRQGQWLTRPPAISRAPGAERCLPNRGPTLQAQQYRHGQSEPLNPRPPNLQAEEPFPRYAPKAILRNAKSIPRNEAEARTIFPERLSQQLGRYTRPRFPLAGLRRSSPIGNSLNRLRCFGQHTIGHLQMPPCGVRPQVLNDLLPFEEAAISRRRGAVERAGRTLLDNTSALDDQDPVEIHGVCNIVSDAEHGGLLEALARTPQETLAAMAVESTRGLIKNGEANASPSERSTHSRTLAFSA